VVTHQLQVERRTAKARRLKTDVLPLDHATNLVLMWWCWCVQRVSATSVDHKTTHVTSHQDSVTASHELTDVDVKGRSVCLSVCLSVLSLSLSLSSASLSK